MMMYLVNTFFENKSYLIHKEQSPIYNIVNTINNIVLFKVEL